MQEMADSWVKELTLEGLTYCMQPWSLYAKKKFKIEEIEKYRTIYACLKSMHLIVG